MRRPLLLAAALLAPGVVAAQPTPQAAPPPIAPAAAAKPRCDAVRIPELPICAETPGGLVYAPDRTEAERNAAYAAAGEARFRRHFDRAPPSYAMVIGRLTPELQATFRAAGIKTVLPWLTAEQQRTAHGDAMRRAAEAQAKASGLDAAATEALLARIMQGPGGQQMIERNPGVVAHELGHAWFIQTFWPGFAVDRQGHYGGPAPDWLDETAAILMEDERMNNDRRDQFRMLHTGKAKGALSGRPDPLPAFLSKDHPMKGTQQALMGQGAAGAAGQPQVQMIVSRQDGSSDPRSAEAPRFYLQGRAWADFLIDRSGRPAIFADIASAMADGRTLEQWLAAEGPRNGLGATLPETERLWAAWLQARYGPPT